MLSLMDLDASICLYDVSLSLLNYVQNAEEREKKE